MLASRDARWRQLPLRALAMLASFAIGVVVLACERGPNDTPDLSYEIEVTHLGRIGSAGDPELIHHFVRASFLADGRIALIDRGDPGRVKFFSRSGEVLGAFGRRISPPSTGGGIRGLGRPFRTDLQFELRAQIRRLAAGNDGKVWMAPLWEYRLEQWDTAGVLLQELHSTHRDLPGADGEPTITPRSPDQPSPFPFIRALQYDPKSELLWVFVAVPREDWRERVARRGSDPFIDVTDFATDRALRQTRIELWDPAARHLVASRLVEGDWNGVDGAPGMGYSYGISPEGLPVVDLWEAAAAPTR